MLVPHYRDLIAWQLAEQIQGSGCAAGRSSPEASKNIRYRDQVMNAAASVTANLVEGFLRFSPGDFRRIYRLQPRLSGRDGVAPQGRNPRYISASDWL